MGKTSTGDMLKIGLIILFLPLLLKGVKGITGFFGGLFNGNGGNGGNGVEKAENTLEELEKAKEITKEKEGMTPKEYLEYLELQRESYKGERDWWESLPFVSGYMTGQMEETETAVEKLSRWIRKGKWAKIEKTYPFLDVTLPTGNHEEARDDIIDRISNSLGKQELPTISSQLPEAVKEFQIIARKRLSGVFFEG